MKLLDLTVATTQDRERAQASRFRWWSDKSGTYRLRLRGLLPLRWFQ